MTDHHKRASSASLDSLVSTRGTVIVGYSVVFLFFLAFIIWGGSVPLTTAAIASGVVGVEGQKKRVQHLEGGIVRDIHVQDGDVVEAGQSLITLDDIQIRTDFNSLQTRYIQTGSEHARWIAEQNDLDVIDYPHWLLEIQDRETVSNSIRTQSEILAARRAVFQETLSSLTHKLAQSEEEARAAQVRIKNLDQKKRLIQNELSEYRRLEKKGLVTRSRLFDLQKQISNINLELSDSQSNISVEQEKTAQLNAQVAEVKNTRKQESAEQATALANTLTGLKLELTAIRHQLDRINVKAPIAGYVINSLVNTRGGVVLAGDTIMEIMPKDERLLLNCKISPADRDTVRVGQKAEVRFSAFSRRSTQPVAGVVKLISADSVMDPLTSTPYYSITVELQEDPSAALNGEAIFPGMQAEVLIVTGAQTFLSYLTSPVSRSFNRAFREN